MTKTVYIFDDNNVYIHPYLAHEDPLNPGQYVTPTDSTDVAPPTLVENEAAQWVNGAWVVVADFRDQQWYDQTTGDVVLITDVGSPASNLAPTLPNSILVLQAESFKIAELQTDYKSAINANISYTTVGGVTQTFKADDNAFQNLSYQLHVYVSAGGTFPDPYFWQVADGTLVPFTLQDIKNLTIAIGDRGYTAFQHLVTQEILVQTTAAAPGVTVAQIQAITW